MHTIRTFTQNYHLVNQQLAEFETVLGFHVSWEPQLIDIEYIKELQKDLSVKLQYYDN